MRNILPLRCLPKVFRRYDRKRDSETCRQVTIFVYAPINSTRKLHTLTRNRNSRSFGTDIIKCIEFLAFRGVTAGESAVDRSLFHVRRIRRRFLVTNARKRITVPTLNGHRVCCFLIPLFIFCMKFVKKETLPI